VGEVEMSNVIDIRDSKNKDYSSEEYLKYIKILEDIDFLRQTKCVDVTASQKSILMELIRADDTPISYEELELYTALSKGSIIWNISALVKNEYIEKFESTIPKKSRYYVKLKCIILHQMIYADGK
jgi:hypothetical protein